MKYNFEQNTFTHTETAGDSEFIIGTDTTFTEKDVLFMQDKLRNLINGLQIPKGHPVCIYGEKEAAFPVAIITLISLDIPYVPIDAMMPFGRIKSIAEQTNSKVIINCTKKSTDNLFEIEINNLFELVSKNPVVSFTHLPSADPVRYILFTSGSTGSPKGVQITASALNSFAGWYLTWPLIQSDCIFMNQAPFSFDISLCDLIGAFGNGSKLVLNNPAIFKDGNLFLSRLKQYNCNTLVCTPSFIQMYLTMPDFNGTIFKDFRQVIFMGEELHASIVKKLKSAFPALKVVNAYGPTEATVVVTYVDVTTELLGTYEKSLPIGYKSPVSEIIILDKDDETGVGEIGISGPNLSIGYLNDTEKTQNAFIKHNGEIVYKTGDLGYFKNNLLFYLGRKDSQIKLNGYRIELDEISSTLITHPSIKNAAVIPLSKGSVVKKIVCYVIPEAENSFIDFNTELRNYLLNYLPAYMIPAEFIVIGSFPLNSNYKTDKKALLNLYLNT